MLTSNNNSVEIANLKSIQFVLIVNNYCSYWFVRINKY